MIRFARSYEFSPHHTGTQVVSSLRASSIPTTCVRSRRHFSFDHVTILRQTTRRARIRGARRRDFSRREGFQAAYFRQDLIRRDRATGSPERYVDRHRFVTSLRVRSSQTRDFLSSGSFRPLLLFFPDDGERFPRRRVSRACPEDGTRGFEAPTRRKDRRRGEHRGARFFVVARASSPRERALTCVIGSDSEYAKRPREVPI